MMLRGEASRAGARQARFSGPGAPTPGPFGGGLSAETGLDPDGYPSRVSDLGNLPLPVFLPRPLSIDELKILGLLATDQDA